MPAATRVPHNIPRELTTLVGRTAAAAEVACLLEAAPLVTLVGVGGAGKTRLALRVAQDRVRGGGVDVADGVWLVELAALADPSTVGRALAAVLGVAEQPTRPLEKCIAEAIGTRQLLLVLDNCEHVVDVCAAITEDLLDAAPGLHVLATSREPLGVAGEVTWAVPPLSLPASDEPEAVATSEAGQLFVARARAARRDFQLSASNAAAIAHVCRQLDGIPLAIELAAARTPALGPADIATRLDNVLHLLVGGRRTAPTRQQSLQAAIEWSYRLLEDRERWLFEQLSVFAGGFDLDAAEAIGHPDLGPGATALLERLVTKSLVQAEPLPEGSMRYRLLEPIRQFALERLAARGDLADARRQHAAHLLAFAQVGGPALRGPDQLEWHRRLERERDNLRAAFDYTVEVRDSELGVALAAALCWGWTRPDRRTEGLSRLADALALPVVNGQETQRAEVLCTLAMISGMQGDVPRAIAWFEQAQEALQATRGSAHDEIEANLLAIETMQYLSRGDTRRAQETAEQGLALTQRVGLPWLEARHLQSLSDLALARGDAERARELIDECLRLARATRDLWNEAMALNGLGDVLRSAGDPAGAERAYSGAVELFGKIEEYGGMPHGAWAGLPHNLGYIALAQGAAARAIDYFTEAARRYQQYGPDWRGVAECVMGLGSVAVRMRQPVLAARLFGAAEAALERLETMFSPTNLADYERSVGALRGALDPDQLAEAWRAGRTTGLEYALREAQQLAQSAPPARTVADLTPRELDVARLVARGLTNRQVAESLVITEKTAANHLQHVLDKLDLRSRSQLAARGTELGL